MIANAGEAVGKEELPLAMQTCVATNEISMQASQRLKIEPLCVSAIPLLAFYLMETRLFVFMWSIHNT